MYRGASFSVRVIEAGWLALVVGVPLSFSPWARNPFELPKVALLWAVAAIMGAAWLVHTQATFFPDSTALPEKSHRKWPAAALSFVIVLFLATLFSTNPLQSAIGSYDRMQGLLTMASYMVVFLLVACCLREREQVRRLLVAVSWGSVPVVLYGLIQAAGIDPVNWNVDAVPVIGTLGRSNFVGAYLVQVLPFSYACFLQAQGRMKRSAYAALIGAQLVCLAMTRARAAWLGTVAAGVVILLIAAWIRGHRRYTKAVVTAGVLCMLGGLVALALIPGWTGSFGSRTTIWRAVVPLIVRRPILGYGPETFSQVFTTVFPPELVYLQGRAVLVDRAHNLVLDTLVTTGLAGLASYCLLLGTVMAAGLRIFVRASDAEVRWVLAVAIAATVGHLVEVQLSFPVTTMATLFWVSLGVLVAPWWLGSEQTGPVPIIRRRANWVRFVLAAILMLSTLPASLLVLAADLYAGSANVADELVDLEKSIESARRATTLWFTQTIYYQNVSWLYLQGALKSDDPVPRFQAAEEGLDAARQLTPNDYRIWVGYGELYSEWGRLGDRARFAQAEAAYRRAADLFPSSAMIHTGWGMLYLAQDRLAEATAQFHQAVSLDHTDHWAYWHLGSALLAQGDLAGAEAAYRNALRWSPDMSGAYRGLGDVYRRWGRPDAALEAYLHALDLAPEDPDLYLEAARSFRDLGETDLACDIVERGLMIIPQHPDLVTLDAFCGNAAQKGGD